jgi:hypothetical protein
MAGAGTVGVGTVAGVGAVDGRPGGAPVGDLGGGGLGGVGVAAGAGADHVSLWRQDFTEEDVSFDALFQVRGAPVGSL